MPSEDYELAIKDVLNSIAEMRQEGEYDEDTLEGLDWRISPPRECQCQNLDDDLLEQGYTCYNCYEFRKDNPSNLDTGVKR